MFLINLLDLIGVGFALAFAYPFALMLIPPARRSALALALLTLALSLGGLTLWMLLLAWIGALTAGAVIAGITAAFAAAYLWILRTQAPGAIRQTAEPALRASPAEKPLRVGAALIILGMGALVVLNALYWPFHDDDAVSIYALQSAQIYQAGALPTGEGLYEAYPMLLPLSHVFSYLVAGHVNEYLAKVAVAALGVGTLGAAVALGLALYRDSTGLVAGVLLAITPMVARWASSGYTDIPAAFFVTLAALVGWWLRTDGSARAAFLFGLLAGLAAWTKNSTLVVAGSAGLWVLYLALRYPDRVTWDRIMWCAVGGALAAGPWYLRNLYEFGYLVPQTVWVDQAERTAANLVPFLLETDRYFLPGIVFTAGLFGAFYDLIRGDTEDRDRALLLLGLVVPFAAAWWWMASYDSRFLLAVLPLIAVMGARVIVRGWRLIWRDRPALSRAMQIAVLIAVVLLALPAARKAVSFKGEMARDPFMDDTKRHQITLGPIYDVALYLNDLPAEGQILSSSYFLPFHVNRDGVTQVVVGGLADRAALARYDYVVTNASRRLFTVIEESDVTLLAEIGEFRVYRVVK